MSLVSDIITQAFLNIGAIAPGETITSAESADAFLRLNQLLSSESTDQLMCPTLAHGAFTLTAGLSVYTLGPAGTLSTSARVLRVTGASSFTNLFRQNVAVMSFDRFAATVKDPLATTSVLASALAVDGSFPSCNMRVFPTPAASPGTLWLDYYMAIAQFTTVGDTINLPDGWTEFLHFNLAVALYPQYARSSGMDPILAANAKRTRDALMSLNAQILGAGVEPAEGGE